MGTFLDGVSAPFLLLFGTFTAITALLWFLLPFSIFGIKSRLDEQIRLLRSLNERLAHLERDQRSEARDHASRGVSHYDTTAVEEPAEALTHTPGEQAEPRLSGEKRWQQPDRNPN